MKLIAKVMLLAGTAMGCAGTAYAQDEAASESVGLGDIVVTAQRRAENLQDVPIAVSAVTAEAAEKLGVTDIATLTNVIPGFTFNRQAAGSQPFIRGVGNQSTTIGNEPSVAIFVDDQYIPTSNAAMFEFNNIDSIEVLKGPQGTLFGRNATGGVVHVHTRKPTFEPSADIELDYGNFETVTAKGYVNVPLGDKVAANLAAYRTYQGDGWGKDIYTGRDVFKRKAYGFRGKLLFELDDTTEILLTGSFNNQFGDAGFALRNVEDFAGRGGISYQDAGAGFYDSQTANGDFYDADFTAFSGKLSKDFGAVRLVSITGYTNSKTHLHQDISAYRKNFVANYDQDEKSFTQELQILSSEDSAVQWIFGGFFMKDNSLFDGRFTAEGPARGTLNVGEFATGINLGPGPSVPPAVGFTTSRSRQKTTSYSGFAQATYELFDRFSLTAGLRYTSDKRSIGDNFNFTQVNGAISGVPSGPFEGSDTFNKLTWRLAADYKFTQDVMVYAAYNRGFKSGVYATSSYNAGTRALIPAVRPETIDAYTAGFKTELFDKRVRFNVEGFYYKYKNIQVQNNLPGAAGIELLNGGKATLKGVEAEMTVAPFKGLQITGAVSVVDGKYDEFLGGPTYFAQAPNPATPYPAGCAGNPFIYPANGSGPIYPVGNGRNPSVPATGGCDLSGNKMLQVIPFSSNLSAIYTLPTSVGTFDVAATWLHTDPFFFEPDNNQYVRQKAVDLVNASLRWEDVDGALNMRLWVNNLTKEKYYSYIANGGTSGPKGSPAAPRTYGVTLGAKF